MRIAHLADPHLGYRKFARLTPRGLNQREADVGEAFTSAIDGVIAARPDVVLIAGDLFHQVRPTNSAILLAMRQFSRLQRSLPKVPVIVIAGNHDTPRSSDTVSIFGVLYELGVYVVSETPQRIPFPELDLSVLAIPHKALFESPRPAFDRAGTERYQVLMLHGETPGLFGADRSVSEPGGAMLHDAELTKGQWDYVALGHYHVQHQVHPGVWYSGALDYVSSNPWGELHTERREKIAGKGWLLVDLEHGTVERRPISPPRRVIDLPALDGGDLAAPELDRLLAEAVARVPGGINGAIVRQVVTRVLRPTARELDHAQIRRWKASALDFQLDLRRPTSENQNDGSGSPGGGARPLEETVAHFLGARRLPPGMAREPFLEEGIAAFAATVDSVGDD